MLISIEFEDNKNIDRTKSYPRWQEGGMSALYENVTELSKSRYVSLKYLGKCLEGRFIFETLNVEFDITGMEFCGNIIKNYQYVEDDILILSDNEKRDNEKNLISGIMSIFGIDELDLYKEESDMLSILKKLNIRC